MASQQQKPVQEKGLGVVVRDFFRDKPFTAVLSLWGGIMAISLGRLYTRPIPVQLKIIQARIYAQAGLISGAAGIALATSLTSDQQAKGPATSSWKVRNFEPVTASPAVAPAVAAAPVPLEAAAAAAPLK